MPMQSVRALAATIEDTGETWTSWFYKTGGPSNAGAKRWLDASMGAGTPKYNAYVGSQGEATALVGTRNNSIYVGPGIDAGKTRYLHSVQMICAIANLAPSTWMLLDYLLCYPLIDGDSTDQQDMVQTDAIPRYASGQVMIVCTTPAVTDAQATMIYTNEAGVAGRSTQVNLRFQNQVGHILSGPNTAQAPLTPFVTLQSGDAGVKSIESITLATPLGGFAAAVIVQPVTTWTIPDNNLFCEVNPFKDKAVLPEIRNGAYLNLIYLQLGAAVTALPIMGHLQFVWS